MTNDEREALLQNDSFGDAIDMAYMSEAKNDDFNHESFVRAAMFSIDTATLQRIMDDVRKARNEA